jgi:hypothetical protein
VVAACRCSTCRCCRLPLFGRQLLVASCNRPVARSAGSRFLDPHVEGGEATEEDARGVRLAWDRR